MKIDLTDKQTLQRLIKSMEHFAFEYGSSLNAPEDLVQGALNRVVRALAGNGQTNVPSTYYWKALRSEIADQVRKAKREAYEEKRFDACTELRHHPDCARQMGRLTQDEIRLMELRERDKQSWEEISRAEGQTAQALRQIHSRTWGKIEALTVIDWIREGRTELINQYRLSNLASKTVAARYLQAKQSTAQLRKLFDKPDYHTAIQNAVLILRSLGKKLPAEIIFLEKQARNENLVRGNRNYLVESLIDLKSPSHLDCLRRFIIGVHDMPGSVRRDDRPSYDQDPVSHHCIFESFSYAPVGGIPRTDLEQIRTAYLSGIEDVDHHRTLAWLLLRVRPNDTNGLRAVIDFLGQETDQTNAYYVVKYIMGPGWKFSKEALSDPYILAGMRRVASRWKQNSYMAQSASRFASKLEL